MQKLILKNGMPPGDVVMLIAAVRDLHRCYPNRFQTDVRTACPQLWEHNPWITTLSEDDPDAAILDCKYPLIDVANQRPYHCLHGFIDFLNQKLGLQIRPTEFKGDIHLSAQEKAWYSQVHELTRQDIPFWIVCAGGKYDVTVKWWSAERYQQVIDHFRKKILFVQVGAPGHHHPKLDGALDLRGRTDLRQLVRLVYHSQGILCGVTALMHLAAAVETKTNALRPCVVVAGGREPVHWEAYPGHQFIHTIGALDCCRLSGCWRDRTHVLGDGDHRDGKAYRCHHLKEDLPQCMDLISAEEVCRRIELYFQGGLCRYLQPSNQRAARKGIKASLLNRYDDQPLNLHNARAALENFVERLKKEVPPKFSGRGIVICAGGVRYFTCAWVCIGLLRQHGCRLPVQVWHLGQKEMTPQMEQLLEPLGVECVDATGHMQVHPARRMGGWELKSYALVHCPFSEVLFLDADNVPLRDPEYLFNEAVYKAAGAVFWPDYGSIDRRTRPIWRSCRLRSPAEREFESGQMLFNKNRCWKALRLSLWFNEHSDFFYRHMHGDKETFHLAFRKLRTPYHLIQTPIQSLKGIMCQHDFNGERVFQHRNTDKWNLLIRNKRVRGFRFDADCRRHLRKLQQVWNGGVDQFHFPQPQKERMPKLAVMIVGDSPNIEIRLRQMTDAPIKKFKSPDSSLTSELFLQAIQSAKNLDVNYILFLITPITINCHLIENLLHWRALKTRTAAVASLTNRGYAESACHTDLQSFLMKPDCFQAQGGFLIRKDWLMRFARKRKANPASARSMIVQALSKRNEPLFQHMPSLVQALSARFPARDFDRTWKHFSS